MDRNTFFYSTENEIPVADIEYQPFESYWVKSVSDDVRCIVRTLIGFNDVVRVEAAESYTGSAVSIGHAWDREKQVAIALSLAAVWRWDFEMGELP